MPKKDIKMSLVENYIQLSSKYCDLNKRLTQLHNDDKITAGSYMMYNSSFSTGYRFFGELYTTGNGLISNLKKVSVFNIKTALFGLEDTYNKALEFVTEQESLPVELSQKALIMNAKNKKRSVLSYEVCQECGRVCDKAVH